MIVERYLWTRVSDIELRGYPRALFGQAVSYTSFAVAGLLIHWQEVRLT